MANRTCSVDGCERPSNARGLCKGHAQRFRRTGSPGGPIATRPKPGGTCLNGCGQTVKAKGLCNRCYQRLWHHGDPTINKTNRGVPVEDRFARKVEVADDGCWLWMGTVNRKGYGMFWPDAAGTPAHRWSYEHHVGPIPAGLQLDHLCRVRHCVNPEHLEPVTAKENQMRSPFNPAARTHCPQGHPYDAVNTYLYPDGRRRACRTCVTACRIAYQARKGLRS